MLILLVLLLAKMLEQTRTIKNLIRIHLKSLTHSCY